MVQVRLPHSAQCVPDRYSHGHLVSMRNRCLTPAVDWFCEVSRGTPGLLVQDLSSVSRPFLMHSSLCFTGLCTSPNSRLWVKWCIRDRTTRLCARGTWQHRRTSPSWTITLCACTYRHFLLISPPCVVLGLHPGRRSVCCKPRPLPHRSAVFGAVLVADDDSLVLIPGSYDHTAKLWDARAGAAVLTVDHGAPVESVLMFPSGGLFVTAGMAGVSIGLLRQ